MKIKTNKVITDLAGKPVTFDNAELTVGKVIAQSLIAPQKGGEYAFDRVKLMILAQDFYKSTEVDLDAVDLEKILKLLDKDEVWAPLIMGRAIMALKEQQK